MVGGVGAETPTESENYLRFCGACRARGQIVACVCRPRAERGAGKEKGKSKKKKRRPGEHGPPSQEALIQKMQNSSFFRRREIGGLENTGIPNHHFGTHQVWPGVGGERECRDVGVPALAVP